MSKILLISSNVHKELSSKQLELCTDLVKNAEYSYQVELLQAGAYEIPFVINTYQQQGSFDAYIALGLILNMVPEHYENIMSHIRYCFSHFALNNIIVGNGIISAATIEELHERVLSPNPCLSGYSSAFHAVDKLIQFKKKIIDRS